MKHTGRKNHPGCRRWLGLLAAVAVLTGAVASAQDRGPEITNVFFETDLREVLLNLSDQSGIPIMTDPSVSGYVTIEFANTPLEACLDRVLTPLGYSYRRLDDYYLVGSANPERPAFPLLATTELYRPKHVRAVDIPKLLSAFYEPYVRVDATSNTVALTGSQVIVERLKADLARIDAAPKQIMIEALVTEVSQENIRELGADGYFAATSNGRSVDLAVPLGNTSDSSVRIAGARVGDQWGDWGLDYSVVLRALMMEGKVNVRANPQVATAEGRTAKIFVGQDEYHTIATGQEPYLYSRLEVIKVGISLEITPYLAENGDITVDVKTSVSDVTGMGVTGLPVVSTRDVTTRITVPDGESVVIGGLQNEYDRRTVKKLPLLGDLPFIGPAFRNTAVEKTSNNVIIVITPKVLGP